MLANLLNVAGVDHVITLDLHASQMQGFFKCPVDNLIAEPLIARWIKHNVSDWQQAVVVSKNPGGTKRVTSLADALKLSFGIVTTDRRRRQYQDYSVNGSVIFERFGTDGASDDDPTLEEETQIEIHTKYQAPEKLTDQDDKTSRSRRRAPSNPFTRRLQNASDTPSSPLAKSQLPDHSPSPDRLIRTSTAPAATAEHEEANAEEFIDEVCFSVISMYAPIH
jgi:ribose-phosphate pyrophosphokinase